MRSRAPCVSQHPHTAHTPLYKANTPEPPAAGRPSSRKPRRPARPSPLLRAKGVARVNALSTYCACAVHPSLSHPRRSHLGPSGQHKAVARGRIHAAAQRAHAAARRVLNVLLARGVVGHHRVVRHGEESAMASDLSAGGVRVGRA
eukprot:351937-Chlamydomonas_euryale.AAC.19